MTTATIDETSLRLEGIDALNKALGASKALRFLSLLHREKTDYVGVSEKIYEGQTVDEIFDRASRNWRK